MEENLTVQLGKPYKFEGTEYREIDLSGLAALTVGDVIRAQRALQRSGETAAFAVCETTTAFARELAAAATKMPDVFFRCLPRGAAKRVTAAVQQYLNAEDTTENHVLRFEAPYCFGGKEYTEVDLSGIAQITGMNESEAENRMAKAGFLVTETGFNYLYACIIAQMATGLPEEFFTGLPVREAMKLKNAVNDADFFA